MSVMRLVLCSVIAVIVVAGCGDVSTTQQPESTAPTGNTLSAVTTSSPNVSLPAAAPLDVPVTSLEVTPPQVQTPLTNSPAVTGPTVSIPSPITTYAVADPLPTPSGEVVDQSPTTSAVVVDSPTPASSAEVVDRSPAASPQTSPKPATTTSATSSAAIAGSALEADDALSPMTLFDDFGDQSQGVARWTVEIIESFPHDPAAFTQGLEKADGVLYESTGLFGRSSLRTVNSITGEVKAKVDLDDDLFGEGLTIVGDRVIQLTWLSGRALVYDRASLELLLEHSYQGEGWGLCALDEGSKYGMSGQVLVMSDGSDHLTVRDPATFEVLARAAITATNYDGRLDYLNELECVEGLVIANVWQTNRLLVINPADTTVLASIDAAPLLNDVLHYTDGASIDVLNGVAHDAETDTFWMTGKLWPRLYRVRLVEAS